MSSSGTFLQVPGSKQRSKLYTGFQIQHGPELRNPYKDLIPPLKTTQLINIYATDPKRVKRGSIMTQTGTLSQTGSQVPPLFVLATGDVLAELKIPSLSMRTTGDAIDHLPHAPKPPSTKYKIIKAGIKGAMPVDDNTPAIRNAEGKIVSLAQNQKYKPQLIDDLGTMQYPIPLEKIIMGLNNHPPELIIMNPESVYSSGILEFKVNSEDPKLTQATYKIRLNDTNNLMPLETAKNRESPAVAMRPHWWNNQWGEFSDRVQQGHQLSYKPTPDSEYKPYEVYGRNDGNGNMLVITGDQDLHTIPRSIVFNVGELAIKAIDTHKENGADELEFQIKEVHTIITMQMISQMQSNFNNRMNVLKENIPNENDFRLLKEEETNRHNTQVMSFLKQRNLQLNDFFENSNKYVKNLGEITPFEAYVAIRINLRQAELGEKYQKDPESVMFRLNQVKVTTSFGLDHILENKLDIDLNPIWFDQNHDPEGCIKHVNSQLTENRFVPADNLVRYMQELENSHSHEMTVFERASSSKPVIVKSSRDPNYSNLTIDIAKKAQSLLEQDAAIKIYAVDLHDKIHSLEAESKSIDSSMIKNMVIVTGENNQKSVIYLNENKISSNLPGEKGQEQVKLLLAKADLKFDSLSLAKPKPKNIESSEHEIKQVENQSSSLKHN